MLFLLASVLALMAIHSRRKTLLTSFSSFTLISSHCSVRMRVSGRLSMGNKALKQTGSCDTELGRTGIVLPGCVTTRVEYMSTFIRQQCNYCMTDYWYYNVVNHLNIRVVSIWYFRFIQVEISALALRWERFHHCAKLPQNNLSNTGIFWKYPGQNQSYVELETVNIRQI